MDENKAATDGPDSPPSTLPPPPAASTVRPAAPDAAPAGAAAAAPLGQARRFSSRALFDGHRELLIEHEGEIYRLRRTRGGKLILNK